ncbi:tRNA pseudouridine(38-40) synthase [Malassezia cuniculi]|uniref:tRNA pseudouridine synthase 1 n=1 Tax=Malassezia cuniculi TaxID=948313 RepID=A0AAF0ERI6_9BASI|nr:tRNA pseudouridine(38-40) synthase [Malassezia cuniculi]
MSTTADAAEKVDAKRGRESDAVDGAAGATGAAGTADAPEGVPPAKVQRTDSRRDAAAAGSGSGCANDAGNDADNAADNADNGEASSQRLAKRKVAIFFGYCGSGYSGLQVNPGVKTIEGDVFDAFCRAGAVSEDNAVNPNKVQLQRAARTDRGVHAAGNLLTLKLILEPPQVPEGQTLVEYVNTLLPEQIRLWDIRRVQSAFNARTSCDSRMYEYLLPTYVFLPPKPMSSMWRMLRRLDHAPDGEAQEGETDLAPWEDPLTRDDPVLNHPFWREHGYTSDFATDVAAKRNWRISAEQLDRVRAVFSEYTGSHNFHNYTVGKEFRDKSAYRNMKRLSISEPQLIEGTEWVSVKLHGQSFMLHQIRKMIGLLVLLGRTNAPKSLISETYGPARIHVPKAPGLGLLLEEPFFAGYNIKVANSNARIEKQVQTLRSKGVAFDAPAVVQANSGIREAVDYDAFRARMDAFKQRFIYDEIHRTEAETSEYVFMCAVLTRFAKWLNYLDVFVGPDFEYLNARGVVPQCAILRVGEQRRAPGGQPRAKKEHEQNAQHQQNEQHPQNEQHQQHELLGIESDDDEGGSVPAAELEG